MSLKVKIVLQFILLAGIFFSLWAIIAFLFPQDFKYEPHFSTETEEKVGEKLTEMILESQSEVTDSKVIYQIKTIARRVKSGIPDSQYRYKFHVIYSKEANAFTLPGGNIIIYTGLIELADNPEQLAGVIAHEMGHAEKKHVLSRLFREFGIAAVSGIILNDKSGTVTKILKHLLSTSFDRDEEREADRFALETLVAAHIHPHHFADFFEKLSDKYGERNGAEILMTHPGNDERIRNAMHFKVPDNFKEIPIEEVDFPELKSLLDRGI